MLHFMYSNLYVNCPDIVSLYEVSHFLFFLLGKEFVYLSFLKIFYFIYALYSKRACHISIAYPFRRTLLKCIK